MYEIPEGSPEAQAIIHEMRDRIKRQGNRIISTKGPSPHIAACTVCGEPLAGSPSYDRGACADPNCLRQAQERFKRYQSPYNRFD